MAVMSNAQTGKHKPSNQVLTEAEGVPAEKSLDKKLAC